MQRCLGLANSNPHSVRGFARSLTGCLSTATSANPTDSLLALLAGVSDPSGLKQGQAWNDSLLDKDLKELRQSCGSVLAFVA